MKKNVRLVLLFALIAVMLVMTAVFASAADVATADDFKAAVAAGGEINLTDNITLDAGIIIDKDVTINGDGHTITFTAGTALETPICNSADASPAVRTVESYAFNLVGGTVVFNNVTVSVPVYTAPAEGEEEVPAVKTGIFVFTGAADVTFNTVVTDQGYITVMFGAPGKLTVNEGTSLGASGYLNYALGSSKDAQDAEAGVAPTVVITGGTISNATTVVSGDLARFDSSVNMTISGGTLVSRSDAVYISGAATTAASIKMTAGTVDAAASAFNVYGPVSLEITGGTVTKNIKYRGSATAKIENLAMKAQAALTLGGSGNITVTDLQNTLSSVAISGSCNVTVKGLTVSAGTCITIKSSGAVVIDDCTLTGNGSGGVIYISDANAKNVTVKNSRLYSYSGIRFSVAVDGGTYTVEKCIFRPQYTGTADNITDSCPNPNLIRLSAAATNTTFKIIDCNISNLEYGSGETLSVTGSGTIYSDTANSGNSWTFDGCTINWKTSSSSGVFATYTAVPLTLKNCTVIAESTAAASTSSAGLLHVNGDQNTVTVIGGSYTYTGNRNMVRYAAGTTLLTIDGATFVNKSAVNMFRMENCNAKFTISNATLTQEGAATMFNMITAKSGTMTIKDSTLDSGSNLTIELVSGGKHNVLLNNVTVDAITIASDYTYSVELTDVEFDEGELVDPSGVAAISTVKNFKINGTAYTWEEVMDAVKAGDTIVLVGDWGTVLEITAPVAFTLDANGNNVGGFTVAAGCNVTIVNCNVSVGIGVALTVPEGATVTLGEGNSFTNTGSSYLMNSYGTLTITGGAYAGTIHNGKGAVTIENGTFTHSGTFKHANGGYPIIWMNDLEATTTINDGTFTKTAAEHAMDCIIGTNDGNAKIVINGGTFEILGETHGHVANLHSSEVVEINGGTFISHNANYPVIRINGVAGTRYAAGGSEAGTPYASVLQNFTTNGGSCGVQILTGNANAWAFTVKNATILNAAQSLFVVNRSSGTVTFEGGRYTLTGETADASALNVIKGNVILDGVMFINNNATSTAAIAAGEGANVTLNNVIVLANNGDAYVSATETVAFGSATVKYSDTSYKLWMTNAGEAAAELDNGASVRIDATEEMTGIRFTGSAKYVEGATYGILIAPADYVAAAGAFTKEALDTWAAAKSIAVPYVMAEAQKSLHDNGDGTVSFSVALVDIQSRNYGRSFAAVPYVTVGGKTTYGDYDSTNNARSMKSVATEALADYLTTEQFGALDPEVAEKYKYEITINDVTYMSKYSADDRTALEKYTA